MSLYVLNIPSGSSEPKLAELVLVLKAVDWHSLGIQLDIEKSKLDEIDDQFSLKQIDRKRADMFGYWLDNEEYPTWEMIVKALEKMGGCNRAIRTIRSEYLNATKPDSSIQSASSSTTPRSSGMGSHGFITVLMFTLCIPNDYVYHSPVLTFYTQHGTTADPHSHCWKNSKT